MTDEYNFTPDSAPEEHAEQESRQARVDRVINSLGSRLNAAAPMPLSVDASTSTRKNVRYESARDVFKSYKPESVADAPPKHTFTAGQKARAELMKKRESYRIGIPRMLNQYSTNPLFSAYFESLGIRAHNLVYSDYTTEELYKEGAKRGAIDPCFPSKLGIPHVHNLIFKQHEKKPLNAIFFPMIDDLKSEIHKAQDCRACPTVTATPDLGRSTRVG